MLTVDLIFNGRITYLKNNLRDLTWHAGKFILLFSIVYEVVCKIIMLLFISLYNEKISYLFITLFIYFVYFVQMLQTLTHFMKDV